MLTPEHIFLQQVEANIGIIRKIVHLYVEHPDDRRDLQQEILYQAWKAFPGFQGLSKFSTWLYRISLNTVLTFRKRESRSTTAPLEAIGPDVAAPDDNPSDNAERLYHAIRQLKETDRALILLHLDGFGNDEIADIAGLSANHVAVKLHRIKTELTKRLNA
jgi:RNA polymerase sigma-70 factor (ECF subfamily)